jgi:menaquinol-cytochrome c reductase cytochrome b subunit
VTRVRSKRRQQLEQAIMLPVDWLEERSGIVGAVRYFLFRKVPHDTNWFHTLGSATLTAFIVQLITGVILAFYYKPSPNEAYASIQNITNELTLGWLVRGMHRWGASVFIILLFLHMGRVFLFGAYKYPRELNWLIGVLLLVLAMLEGFTGYLLPWDQTSYWATVVGINLNATAPIAGPFIADFLRGGAEIGENTLSIFYSLHMLLIPGGLISLITLHLYLVIRLGVSSPPWSKDPAGALPVEVGPARRGLVQPRPRGNGAGPAGGGSE